MSFLKTTQNNLLVCFTRSSSQMAESITEGILKQWQKKLGEHVEQDEEVATIETYKVLGM